jgi:hypothetical protein
MSLVERDVVLPSKGRFNPEIPEGKLRIRGTTAPEERIFNSRLDPLEKVVRILEACVVEPKISARKLVAQDGVFLFLKIRETTLGPEYDTALSCPACNLPVRKRINLEDLPVKMVADDVTEPFKIHLPQSNIDITMKFLRAEDQMAIDSVLKRRRVQGLIGDVDDDGYILRLAHRVVEVDGKPVNAIAREEFFLSPPLPTRDTNAIMNRLEEVDFGVDLSVVLECAQCGHYINTQLSMIGDFFRSKTTAGR